MEYTNSQITEIIREYLHSATEQEVMILRLTKMRTQEQIAGALDISVSTVKRIIRRCSAVIFKHFPE